MSRYIKYIFVLILLGVGFNTKAQDIPQFWNLKTAIEYAKEKLKDYIQIHISTSPKATVVRMSMKSVEEQLPAYFERIHKSFIVNINKAGI